MSTKLYEEFSGGRKHPFLFSALPLIWSLPSVSEDLCRFLPRQKTWLIINLLKNLTLSLVNSSLLMSPHIIYSLCPPLKYQANKKKSVISTVITYPSHKKVHPSKDFVANIECVLLYVLHVIVILLWFMRNKE